MFIAFLLFAGVAAIGLNFIAVGIHTGTILLFEVTSDTKSFVCSVADTQRCHVQAITDLASTSTIAEDAKEVRVQSLSPEPNISGYG